MSSLSSGSHHKGVAGLQTLLKKVKLEGSDKSTKGSSKLTNTTSVPYSELGPWEIRVLALLPGCLDDPLRGKLQQIKLKRPNNQARKDRPHENYEAISYVWGSQDKPHQLYLPDGVSIYITDSLYWALKHFRLLKGTRRLWIDYVCINQTDIQERNSQVAIMGDIYGASSSVLAWLGSGDEADAFAFATVHAMAILKGRKANDVYSLDEVSQAIVMTGLWDEYSKYWKDPDNVAVKGFCNVVELTRRKWFTRLWTAQESHFSVVREVQIRCGGFVANLRNFGLALAHAFMLREQLPLRRPHSAEDYHADGQLRNFLARDGEQLPSGVDSSTFLTFTKFALRGCTDPRDRIFAIRRILGVDSIRALQVNYDVQPPALYHSFITTIIGTGQPTPDYSILAVAGTETAEATRDGLPSWVPDLHHLSLASTLKVNLHPTLTRTAVQYHPGRTYELRIRGNCFAACTIQYDLPDLSTLAPGQNVTTPISLDTLVPFLFWHFNLRTIINSVSPSYDCADGLTPTSFLNYPTAHTSRSAQRIADWTETIPPELRHDPSIRELFLNDPIFHSEAFWKWVHWALTFMLPCPLTALRRLWKIRTYNGTNDLAWLPPQTLPGDQVCYFAESPWPFVVRDRGDGTYTLVGDGSVMVTEVGEACGLGYSEGEIPRLFGDYRDEKLGRRAPWLAEPTEEMMRGLGWLVLW